MFDISTNINRALRIPQTEIRAISFLDEQNLFYSVKQQGQWTVKHYNTATDQVSSLDSKWQFVRFAADTDDSLWLDQQNNLYTGATAQPVATAQFGPVDIMLGRKFNLTKRGPRWYWQRWDQDQYQLYSMAAEHSQPSPLLRSDSPHFSLSATGIFYHSAERQNTDIFQTVAPN
ncbi:MAG: hypothetical protein KKE94_12075 [Gammaproteobacteria bacterium]|nr:hypothetical protein [Gammaproteobacteria bacterium]